MSSIPIHSLPQPAHSYPTPAPNSSLWQSPIDYKSRMIAKGFCGLTTAETTRLSLRLLGACFIAGAGGAIYLAAAGIVSWPAGLIAIPCIFAAAIGSIYYSTTLYDYENPEELEKYKNEASRMSLDQVFHTFGYNNVLHYGILSPEALIDKYRQQMRGKTLNEIMNAFESTLDKIAQCPEPLFEYAIPHPREWAKQWRTETATITFEEILRRYSLEKLEKYALVETGELNVLRRLKEDYDLIKANFDRKAALIEREFQLCTIEPKQRCDAACHRAHQIYQEHFAVRELQGIEMLYARGRQQIQDQQNLLKQEAKLYFDREINAITENGRLQYSELSALQKQRYDNEQINLQNALATADRIARGQIQMVDQTHHDRLATLHREEANARQERQNAINAAKQTFELETSIQKLHKEEAMQPITESFRSSARDLDGSYRAYLRMLGHS